MLETFAGNVRGRDYVVGDIHGCFDLLDDLLARIGFDTTTDRLFSVGDLIDRGPDSERVGAYLDAPWFVSVRGNHEEMLLDAVAEGGDASTLWRMNGGDWFDGVAPDARRALAERMADLPLAIEIDTGTGRAVIVHAEMPGRDWSALRGPLLEHRLRVDDRIAMVWDRESATRVRHGHANVAVAGADVVFFGHTPMRNPTAAANTRWLDTGAFMGRRLTVAEVACRGAVWSLAADRENCLTDWSLIGRNG